jgi:hypothetical protein
MTSYWHNAVNGNFLIEYLKNPARHGGTHLQSQHYGHWAQEFEASLGKINETPSQIKKKKSYLF